MMRNRKVWGVLGLLLALVVVVGYGQQPPVGQPQPIPLSRRISSELDDMLRLINDAISSYKPILGRTPLNVAGAAWWGNAGQKQLLIAIPPSELAITPGAIVGLLGVQNVKGIPTDFYALKLGDKSDAVLLIDTRGKALTSLPVKISGEAALKGVLTPVHIYTSQGGPGQPLGISISLCIGVHEPNCKCSGIYIQF